MYLVDQAVRNVAMNGSIAEAEDRVWSLRKNYCDALRSAAYGYIVPDKPQIVINHFHKKPKPPQVYRKMLDITNWKKDDNFHKENFDRFVLEVAVQAKMIQSERRGTHTNKYWRETRDKV